MNIETLLYDEIETEFEELRGVELGSEQYKVAVDGMTKLMGTAIEMTKVENDSKEKAATRESEQTEKVEQLKESKKNRWFRIGEVVFTTAVSTALVIWGTKTSMNFEKEDTITTTVGRGWFNRIVPRK